MMSYNPHLTALFVTTPFSCHLYLLNIDGGGVGPALGAPFLSLAARVWRRGRRGQLTGSFWDSSEVKARTCLPPAPTPAPCPPRPYTGE